MEITYQDAVESLTTFFNNKDYEKDLSVNVANAIKAPGALASVQMLDNLTDFPRKAAFVHDMLLDNALTVKYKGEVLVTIQVTSGMQLDDVEYFQKHPGIFRFAVEAVFGVFLKNLYPLSSESREAAKQ